MKTGWVDTQVLSGIQLSEIWVAFLQSALVHQAHQIDNDILIPMGHILETS